MRCSRFLSCKYAEGVCQFSSSGIAMISSFRFAGPVAQVFSFHRLRGPLDRTEKLLFLCGIAAILLCGERTAIGQTTPLQFVAVSPCRVVDTRNAVGTFGGPQLAGGSTRTFNLPQSACGIPITAVAYSLNVTVVPDQPLGYLTIWPAGQAQPLVSTLNSDGRIKANAAIVPAGTNGGVSVYVSDATQLVLDIDGYFVPAGTSSSGLQFFPVTPCRIVDTRNANGPLGGPTLSARTSRNFPVQSSACGIPPTAQAYSLNVTAVPQGPLGYLTAWPTGEAQPVVSTLNSNGGEVVANGAIVPAGSGGDISVYVSDSSDVVLDINGYFAPPVTGGLSLYTVTPCRVIDTRNGAGAFVGELTVNVEGSTCAPPSTAQAYVLNATVVPSGYLGYLTMWPDGETQPLVSTLNAYDGAITSNVAIVPTTNGSIDAYTTQPTDLVLDLSSYFASASGVTLPQPQITSILPGTTYYAGSLDTVINVIGTGFTANSVVEWNGTPLQTFTGDYPTLAIATVPAADLASAGTASVTVETPGATPPTSNVMMVNIANPPVPTLTGMSPSSGPIGTASKVTLLGTGFMPSTTVTVNGTLVPSTYNSSSSITANIPAASLAVPGDVNVAVTTPAPGGGSSSAPFSVYLPIAANDIVFNSADGLLYASVPPIAAGGSGNSVVSIDPTTGNVIRQIWVGANPNKLALSTDGTQLFVGLDGAGGVAQVDLKQGKVVNQFSLGGGEGVYNPPMTALYLAAVPESPNSVAVATLAGAGRNEPAVTIYDSGIARANAWPAGEGPLSFGPSASTLYVAAGSTLEQLTVGSSGITAATALSTLTKQANWMQYDNGRLYLSSGQVLNASNGTLLGTFYSGASTPAAGPIVSDSTLGRAFVVTPSSNGSSSNTVLTFNEPTFNLLGSIVVNGAGESGYGSTVEKIVRWGQNGLAFTATFGPSNTQELFIFQSPLVQDLSSAQADLSVALSAPSTATTGTSVSWVATVKNLGPNSSEGATLAIALDPSLVINSVSAMTGTCGTGPTFRCAVGTLASGASVTITVAATPTQAGTLAGTASVASVSYDPTSANNQAATSTAVTGGIYGAVPAVTAISPSLVQAGAAGFILTVTGTGFNENSVVNFNTAQLPTTYVSPTQLTASVSAAQIANYGWAAITVTNPLPGGGVSQILPLTIYDLVNVPASGLLFDPYTQSLYATIPSTATNITGNSVVAINPMTGVVGNPVFVGSEPTVMAETADGNDLYIGLSGADSLAQFNLLNQSLTTTIPLLLTQGNTTSQVAATSLAAMPGTDTTLAVGVTDTWHNFGIFDISGSTGSFRPNLSGIYEGVNPAFVDASHLDAYDSETSGFEFYRYSIDVSGLNEIDGTTLDGMGGFNGGFQLANRLVYGYGGGIANPFTTPPSQVATLPIIDFSGSGATAYPAGAAADPSLQKEFMVLWNSAGTSDYALVRYDLNTYLPEAIFDESNSAFNSSLPIFRFGQDGLALAISSNVGTKNQTPSIMLLRGPFVAPQELQTNSAASLTGSSATTITHGSGNTLLTLTGTNFLPGVAVTWNGSYRATTIVDATHVTVAIPASDVANAGSASLVATNPGAPASNTLTITIN